MTRLEKIAAIALGGYIAFGVTLFTFGVAIGMNRTGN